MKTYNHKYESHELLSEFISEIQITDSDRIFIRIHSAIHTYDEINELISYTKEFLPSAQFIGCSTSHVIISGKVIHDACLISITELEEAEIISGRVACSDTNGNLLSGKELGEKIIDQLPNKDESAFMLIFFPISYCRIESVVNTINEANLPLLMIGGTAYLENEDETNPPYVIAGSTATPNDVAYLHVRAKKAIAYSDYSCGIEPVGKLSQIVTDGTIIKTVDGIQGGKWYADLLGKEALDRDPKMSEVFPIVIQGERDICYHVDYKKYPDNNDYYLETFPELRTGSLVSPGYFHPQKIFDQISDVVTKISERPCESIFAYDCYARASILSNCARWELDILKSTNMSGCLLSGEIITRKGANFYANLTYVLTSISENKDSRIFIDPPDISSLSELQNENVEALNFLLVNSTKTLNKELDYQKNMIRDAVFFNPAVGIDNQLKFQFDNESKHLDKVAILYLNNEKMLRLFSGVTETYGYLTDCYQKLTTNFSTQNLFIYSYQDTSLIIASNNSISREEFETSIDNIQEFLNSQVYEDIHLSYTAISLFDSEDPLSDLESALDYAKQHQLTRVHFADILEKLEAKQEDIHILLVLREALSHNRVYPYFQEIHSNLPNKRRLFEALMRIKDVDGNLYFPDKFLPIAKEYSLYDKLSELMVSNVMNMFKDKESRVTINLNVQDIYNRNMLKMIFNNMKTAPRPENFVFEIVESEEITDYEYIKSFADRIHEYGGKIAIDDFGSGFSNILNIMRIDADYIKIDGALVREILRDPLIEDFIEFMQSWCHKNNQALICEYVENKEIQDIMTKYEIAYSQGYHFSKPHPWSPEDE